MELEQQNYSAPDFIPAEQPDFIPAAEPQKAQPGFFRRMLTGANKGMDAMLDTPGQVYHAFADPAKTPREEQEAAKAPGASHLMLGFNRLITDPMESALRKGQEAQDQGHTSEAIGHSVAGAIPVIGPFAEHMGEEFGKDPASALGEGATYAAVPSIAGKTFGETARGIRGMPPSDFGAKASATGKLLGREVTGRVPILNRFEQFRKPTFNEYAGAFNAKADPQLSLYKNTPKLGNSPLNQEAPVKPQYFEDEMEEARRGGPGNAPGVEPDVATRQSVGDFVKQAQQRPGPKLDEAPVESPVSTIPRTNSGEGVLTQALTALDNKTLLKVARSRGIDVAREAQLKPGAANGTLVKKVIDDFSPDELDEVRNQGIEISRHQPVQAEGVTPERGAEAWHYKVLNTFFPDVNIPKTMAARAQATIAKRPTGEIPAESPYSQSVSSPQEIEAGFSKLQSDNKLSVATPEGNEFTIVRMRMGSGEKAPTWGYKVQQNGKTVSRSGRMMQPEEVKDWLSGLTIKGEAPVTTDWSLENMAKQLELNKKKRAARAGDD